MTYRIMTKCKHAFKILAILACLCLLSACEANNAEIQISENHLSATFDEFPKFKVIFNADIDMPASNEYKTANATMKSLTIEDIEHLIHICVNDDSIQLFEQWNLSQDEWIKKLEKAKPYIGTEKVTERYIEWLEESIKSAHKTPTNTPFNLYNSPSGTPVVAYVKKESSDAVAMVAFIRDGDFLFSYQREEFIELVPESMAELRNFDPNTDTMEHFLRRKPETPTISHDEALKAAQQILRSLGTDLVLYSAEPCSILSNSAIDKETGWMFVFTRKAFSLQSRYEDSWIYVNPDYLPKHVSPWGNEYIKISVDSSGICSLIWQGASIIDKASSQEISLLSLDQVPQAIAKTLYKIYGTHRNENGEGLVFEITDIKLGASIISLKGNTESATFVPVWYIYFNERWNNDEEYLGSNKLILSAIDGSYIEPRISINDIKTNGDIDK